MAAKPFLGSKTVLASLGIDFRIAQEWELLSCLNVCHVLDEALGEDDIDLFQRAVFGLGVEDVDDREEACVHCSEEEVCACDGVSCCRSALRTNAVKHLPHLMFEIMTGVAITMVKFLFLCQWYSC